MIYYKWNGDGGYYPGWSHKKPLKGDIEREKEEEKKEEFLKEEEFKV